MDEEQQKAIDRALEEAKAGKGIPHEEVMKQYKKWLKTGDNQDRPIFKEFGAFEAEVGSEE